MQTSDVRRPSTPPEGKHAQPKVESTPRSRRSAGVGDQTGLRNEIAHRMNSETLTCDFNTFCNHYLPFCPTETEVERAIELLVDGGILSESDAEGRHAWTEFYDKPSRMGSKEDDIFAKIQNITQVLVSNHDIEGRSPNFAYRSCPYTYMKSDIEGGNFKVDGRFELAKTISDEVSTTKSAVLAEYKKYEAEDFRNRKQLLSAASHVMNDDPRRSAVYGITIVDDKMSLWYFSRSHSVKSDEFSFIEDYGHMVLSLVAFIFATEEEIGYDPKILPRTYQDKWCYIYEINGRLFRTEENIFSYRSLCITGRHTRVWKAVEVKNRRELKAISNPVAIKDVWLEKGAKTEHEIQKEIFDDIRLKSQQGSILNDPRFSLLEPKLKEEIRNCLKDGTYKSHFMTIICSELGTTSRERSPQATPIPGLFDEPAGLGPGNPSRMYKPKQHYFVVYSEVATPLDEARDLVIAFRAMKDVITALLLLYLAGWVHRDISAGNVLFTTADGTLRAQLSDLEYSKRYGETGSSSDPKTGTVYFMALEIATNEPLYFRELEAQDEDHDFVMQKLRTRHKGKTAQDIQPVNVFYNYQHDLESVWWIALWFLLCRINHAESNRFGSSIFTDEIWPTDTRRRIFREPEKLLDIALHPDLKPLLEYFRVVSRIFIRQYVKLERSQRDKADRDKDFSGTYTYMWTMLDTVIEELQGLEAEGKLPSLHGEQVADIEPAQVPVASSSKKRITSLKEHDEKSYIPPPLQKRQRRDEQVQVKKHRTRAQTKLSAPE